MYNSSWIWVGERVAWLAGEPEAHLAEVEDNENHMILPTTEQLPDPGMCLHVDNPKLAFEGKVLPSERTQPASTPFLSCEPSGTPLPMTPAGDR